MRSAIFILLAASGAFGQGKPGCEMDIDHNSESTEKLRGLLTSMGSKIPGVREAAQRALREYVWNSLFLPLTKDTGGSEACPDKLPLWQTWVESTAFRSDLDSHTLRFRRPTELYAFPLQESNFARAEGPQPPVELIQLVHFNPPAADFLRRPPQGYSDPLYFTDTLNKMRSSNSAFPAFPRDAIVIKTFWYYVDQYHATPYIWTWRPAIATSQQALMRDSLVPQPKWGKPKCIEDAKAATVCGSAQVPSARFFTFRCREGQCLDVKGTTSINGKLLVLVGMHVSTKELGNWLWATFWWRDKGDKDNPYRKGGSSSVWRNYAMDATISMSAPVGKVGTTFVSPMIVPRNATFNPYSEGATLTNGMRSNCPVCHVSATLDADIGVRSTVLFEQVPVSGVQGSLTTDFMWSVAMHLQNPK